MMILSGLQVHTEQGVQSQAAVVINNGKIHAVQAQTENDLKAEIITFPENYHLIPGFIDLHTHGANGSDVMDATPEALKNICETLAKEGTTSFLATTMTAAPDEIANVLSVVRDFMHTQSDIQGAKILGVHLEGPFLSPQKIGAQRGDKILSPRIEHIEDWQSLTNDIIKLVTLAPELTEPFTPEDFCSLSAFLSVSAVLYTPSTNS